MQDNGDAATVMLGLDGFVLLSVSQRDGGSSILTWTETSSVIRARASLTEQARAEACRRVGQDGHSVASSDTGHRHTPDTESADNGDHAAT